jgi:hypothetical protein
MYPEFIWIRNRNLGTILHKLFGLSALLVIEIQTYRTCDRTLQVISMVEKALQYLSTTISILKL